MAALTEVSMEPLIQSATKETGERISTKITGAIPTWITGSF